MSGSGRETNPSADPADPALEGGSGDGTPADPLSETIHPAPSGKEESPSSLAIVPADLRGLLQSLPALEALALSGRRLTVLAPVEFHPLLRPAAGVEHLISRSPAESRILDEVREAGCTEAVLLDDSWDAAWIALRCRLAPRYGYRGWLRGLFLAPPVERPGNRWPGGERYRELLAAMGVDRPPSWVPRVPLTAEDRQVGERYLRRSQLDVGTDTLVGLVPSTDRSGAGIWPWQRHAELAQTLRRRNPAVRLLILAPATALWPAVRIHEETARFLPVVGPDLDWMETAAVLSHLDLVIGPDSGLLHLAAAAGSDTLELLSRKTPADAEVAGSGNHVLRGRRLRVLGASQRRPLLDVPVSSTVRAVERVLKLEEED